jgi:hypothetical protein
MTKKDKLDEIASLRIKGKSSKPDTQNDKLECAKKKYLSKIRGMKK